MTALLPIREVEKPWGMDALPAPFSAPAGKRIGEVWFEPPAALPQLLVKYIFTSEKLSVQVHPTDAQTLAKGLGKQGKEECWLIVAAEPGASLGIGFNEPLSAEDMRAAALDGSIVSRMTWHQVRPGDFFYIPAGTVHAIGEGVSLIETQQNSDITYRLYDYGRPRELHLEDGMAVAHGTRYPANLHRNVPDSGWFTLVEGPLFRMDQVEGSVNEDVAARYGDRPLLVIPRTGAVRIGAEEILPGSCGQAPRLGDVTLSDSGPALIAQPLVANP